MPKITRYRAPGAPNPLSAYSHAVGIGDLLFVCGMGPRDPETNEVPGLSLGAKGERIRYDIRAETRQTLENIKRVLESAGSSLDRVVDVSVFLTDMEDFSAMNEVYVEYFGELQPTRTTIAVSALPGPIAVEIKVVAVKGE